MALTAFHRMDQRFHLLSQALEMGRERERERERAGRSGLAMGCGSSLRDFGGKMAVFDRRDQDIHSRYTALYIETVVSFRLVMVC